MWDEKSTSDYNSSTCLIVGMKKVAFIFVTKGGKEDQQETNDESAGTKSSKTTITL